ncbi:MAG: hypothetical protein HY208_06970 [Nitrospirae bacterium]|nr:hypothetical protein [Nitrospirota bacterium]
MSARFYIGYVAVVLCLIWGVELVLGSLYARYIIMYTGGVFLAGLVMGQRYEQAWLNRNQVPRDLEKRQGRPAQQSMPPVVVNAGKEEVAS